MQHYDIRKQCEGDLCYDFSRMEKFLNQRSVREALGVGNIDFVSCSTTVYEAMVSDWVRNLEVKIPPLLEDGIKGLIYAGEYDLICNWLGKNILVCLVLTNKWSQLWFFHILILVALWFSYRKFKVGSCHGMVRSEGLRSSSDRHV